MVMMFVVWMYGANDSKMFRLIDLYYAPSGNAKWMICYDMLFLFFSIFSMMMHVWML